MYLVYTLVPIVSSVPVGIGWANKGGNYVAQLSQISEALFELLPK